jgi:tRNA-specific 2-thiouridylase
MKKKVMLGMSGGVDSSVAALLLLQQGYDVTGVTMKLRPDQYMVESQSGGCCSLDDIDDARRVAYRLGIEHLVLNFTQVFSEKVIDYFASEYLAGRTPNPCIACNAHVKFDALLRKALSLEYDYVATGHYAVITQNDEGRWLLKKAPCSKDQSYVLYHLTQHQLAHTLMPLAGMEKSKARELAREAGLPVAHKPDSQEICFVQDNDYASFIRRYTGKEPPPGNFIDQAGNVLGTHKGITHYTIGQRKGLGISFGKPMFVTKIDPISNTVTLGENGSQYASSLIAGKVNLISADTLEAPISAQVKVRYQAPPAPARLTPLDNGKIRVDFQEPQRSVTPGQAAVFYDGDLVLGGGIIETV